MACRGFVVCGGRWLAVTAIDQVTKVDFSQFSQGDEVAVTIVGTIDADGDLALPDNYFLIGSLAYAVDAYRIR